MRHDYAVLATQLVRSGIWLTGCLYAIRYKRALLALGCATAALTSTVYAFANAHYTVPAAFTDASNYLSLLAVAAVIAGLILGTRLYSRRKHWTP